jgi:hypothetical protein
MTKMTTKAQKTISKKVKRTTAEKGKSARGKKVVGRKSAEPKS